jgi:hypothetical protein
MSAAEETVVKPEEVKPTEGTTSTEAPVADPAAVLAVAEASPEMTILAKDPEVIKSNLEKAELVAGDAGEQSSSGAAAPVAEEETSAEPAPAAAEKPKEGSAILSFLKKRVPITKAAEKKIPSQPTETKAESEPAAPATTESTDDRPFEGDYVDFKTHGGFFGYVCLGIFGAHSSGGWKSRMLSFGKEEGYSLPALAPYVAAYKVASITSATERTNAAWDNAAHATVTGSGLMFIAKARALDVPLNIINLVLLYGMLF